MGNGWGDVAYVAESVPGSLGISLGGDASEIGPRLSQAE